jgi:multiple sugar transport system ATP-binding protein
MAALRINDVWKRYGSLPVLKGIDLAIDSGEFAILVGPSGCGKSTLLNIIAGLDNASAGSIEIGDRPMKASPQRTATSPWCFNPMRCIRR